MPSPSVSGGGGGGSEEVCEDCDSALEELAPSAHPGVSVSWATMVSTQSDAQNHGVNPHVSPASQMLFSQTGGGAFSSVRAQSTSQT